METWVMVVMNGAFSEALGFEGGEDFAHRDFDAAVAGSDHVGAGRGHDDGAEDQQADSDQFGDSLGAHSGVVGRKEERGRAAIQASVPGRRAFLEKAGRSNATGCRGPAGRIRALGGCATRG